jgi:hypothetical protein
VAADNHFVEVPPHGAHIHELRFSARPENADRPVAMNLHFDQLHKAHFICASPNLDRFSIDHI